MFLLPQNKVITTFSKGFSPSNKVLENIKMVDLNPLNPVFVNYQKRVITKDAGLINLGKCFFYGFYFSQS